MHSRDGSYGLALQAFDLVISLNPRHVLAWFCESLVLINLGMTNRGKKAFIRATRLACNLSLMQRVYGGAIFFSKKSRIYARRLDRKVRSPQDPCLIWYRTGTDLYRSQKNDEAIAAFRRVLALNPESTRSWHYLAQAYTRLGRYALALEAYGHAIAIDPLNTAIWNNKGLLHRRLGQADAAIAAFRNAIAIDPAYFNGWYNLGLISLDQKQYDQAREAFDRALAIQPGDPRALNRKNLVLQRAGANEKKIP
jgi:tetratricopeptide (TPR) repeat protein